MGSHQDSQPVDEKSNIQIPIDAKYVMKGIMHRGDLEQGPSGDLWSILSQLIEERCGVTDVIKVKSHLEDVGQSVTTQNKIGFHQAAKRLLSDLNLERKAKKAERIGIGVSKRLALVQADIWAKRGAAGDIYELEPLVAVEDTCTRFAIGKLVDELAQQGHLLVCRIKGLRCKACHVYRADRQFSFWDRTPCVPRPCAAEVISQFRKRKDSTTHTQTIRLAASLVFLLWSLVQPARQHVGTKYLVLSVAKAPRI